MTKYERVDEYLSSLNEEAVRNILRQCINELILTKQISFNEEDVSYLYWTQCGDKLKIK